MVCVGFCVGFSKICEFPQDFWGSSIPAASTQVHFLIFVVFSSYNSPNRLWQNFREKGWNEVTMKETYLYC